MPQLFHLHYYVDDVQATERRLIDQLGMRVVGRFGQVGSESVRFDADAGWDAFVRAGARIRLTQLQLGDFDLVLGQGKQADPLLEHIGWRVDEETYERCQVLCERRKLAFREGGRRTFVTTPFGIRLELVAPHHAGPAVERAAADLDRHTVSLRQVTFAVRDVVACNACFSEMLGESGLGQIEFEPAEDGSQFHAAEIHVANVGRPSGGAVELIPRTKWYLEA